MRRNCDSSVICSINSLTLVWLNSKWLHEFIVNYYQYKVRCNKAHWDPGILLSWRA
ncbi:MAG: hypothetical protein ACEY3H_01360 [Wolbachia sp.]